MMQHYRREESPSTSRSRKLPFQRVRVRLVAEMPHAGRAVVALYAAFREACATKGAAQTHPEASDAF